MKIKWISTFLIVLVLFMVSSVQANSIRLYLNDELLSTDVPPQWIDESKLYVPVRAVCEALGATVNWNDSEQQVIVSKDNAIVSIKINDASVYVNDELFGFFESYPILIDDRTMVQVRFFESIFGLKVNWNPDEQIIIYETH